MESSLHCRHCTITQWEGAINQTSLMTPSKLYCPLDYTSYFLQFSYWFEMLLSVKLLEILLPLNLLWHVIHIWTVLSGLSSASLFHSSSRLQLPDRFEICFLVFYIGVRVSDVKWGCYCFLTFRLCVRWTVPPFLKLWGSSFCFLWTVPPFLYFVSLISFRFSWLHYIW